MDQLRYLDFELKIEREGNHYVARVLRSPSGEASNTFTLPFSEDKLENLVLKIGRLRNSTRRIYTSEMAAAQELGGKLFEAVFAGEVRSRFKSSLVEASHQKETGLRLKLRLQDVGELADLPWEFLFDSSLGRFLAQSNQTPIVRYPELPERISPLRVNLPLRILVMISSPKGYVQLDVEREKSLLHKALDPLAKDGMVQVEWLEQATLSALQHRLREGKYHIFHFIGHGGFDLKAEEGVLVLEDEEGRGWQAGAQRIGTVLHDHRTLRLAVLNSCEGARNSRTDPFAGMAANLIQQDIPAVVAMQFEITDSAAIIFASEFYTALAEGLPVDAAVAEARKAIYAQPNDVEWGTPVLYMRSDDGTLFNLKRTPTVEKKSPRVAQSDRRSEEPVSTEIDTAIPRKGSTSPEDLNRDKSTKRIYHLIEIEDERIIYDGKEVSTGQASHDFEVFEDGERVAYKIQLGTKWFAHLCEVRRNDEIIYHERATGLKTIVCKGHRIDFSLTKFSGPQVIHYDGREVLSSRNESVIGQNDSIIHQMTQIFRESKKHHDFEVFEDGETAYYEIDLNSSGCEVKRNNKIIYTDRFGPLRKLWV